jgi:hypothetical protein
MERKSCRQSPSHRQEISAETDRFFEEVEGVLNSISIVARKSISW